MNSRKARIDALVQFVHDKNPTVEQVFRFLVENFGLTNRTCRQYLQQLRQSGMVQSDSEGKISLRVRKVTVTA